ncbi:MAG TPA: hypothetical protein VFK66_05880 [Oryzihumus sp.]|nr:hypothetical protein [Oryzihumus sp.]
MTTFEQVRPLADAVLYEGYLLYPYRADDPKNRVRWQFGVLMAPDVVVADPSERSGTRTELLLEGADPWLEVRARFLQVQRREVQAVRGGSFVDVPALAVGDRRWLPWDEAVEREVDLALSLADLASGPRELPVGIPPGVDTELLSGPDGRPVGRLRRTRLPLTGVLRVEAHRLPGPYGLTRLEVRLDNTTAAQPGRPVPGREAALRRALVAAHLLVRVSGGRLLSMMDPPEWARAYAASCHHEGTYPVLVGDPGSNDMVLASPIILYDHPQVAPESPVAFYDATEVDELLTLRALTLTDEEQQTARSTDARAAALLDEVSGMPADVMDRLHGAVRYLRQVTGDAWPGARAGDPATAGELPWWDPGRDAGVSPETDELDVGGRSVRRGSRVLLRPGSRPADAQDMFLAGRTATVAAVFHDVDGGDHLAVVVEDDPAHDLVLAHGRYLYFSPDEVEVLEGAT